MAKTNKKLKENNIADTKPKELPIEWNIPEGVLTPFVTNMAVQIIENEFKLLFFEIKPPLMLNNPQTEPKTVKADYVGGVIVSADRMPKFINVLQDQLDKYTKKQNDQTE